MKILLDTHCFIWFVLDDPRLSKRVKGLLEGSDSEILISPASFWEISIKISLGKYSLNVSYEEFWERGITENRFKILPIKLRHTAALIELPFHHRDPFDRLLVAQAITENATLASADAVLDAYPIRRIWDSEVD